MKYLETLVCVTAIGSFAGCHPRRGEPGVAVVTSAPVTSVTSPVNTYLPACDKPFWEGVDQVIRVRGSREQIVIVLEQFGLRDTPDGGGYREDGNTWRTAGQVTDDELAAIRAYCLDTGCTTEIVISKETYADRNYENFCDRPPRRPSERSERSSR